jgi:3-(3-hydroxy-phenyl)propionate hydroxylase
MHRQPDGIWRVDYQIGKDEDADEAVKPENVIPRVQSHLDMIGQKGKWAPIWIAMYKAHALSLEKYRHGRVLFAGDAAHLVPIFGVRGANSGIDDADNLAWKLAYIINGLAQDSILDSYSDERVFATQENLSFGTKSTEFMAPPSFAYELMRRAVLTLAVDRADVRSLINPRQSATITYRDSPLNAADPDASQFDAGPAPGAVLAECPIAFKDGARWSQGHLTDLIRPTFTLLAFTETGERHDDVARIAADMRQRRVPFRTLVISARRPDDGADAAWDSSGRLFPMYGASGGTCYLVRPDGHVLGRWRQFDCTLIVAAVAAALDGKPGPAA